MSPELLLKQQGFWTQMGSNLGNGDVFSQPAFGAKLGSKLRISQQILRNTWNSLSYPDLPRLNRTLSPKKYWGKLKYHKLETYCALKTITLLRVTPTMTFIRFVTGKSSGILSDISSGIRSGILSGISFGILPGISSGICSGILSGISSGILSGRWGPAVRTGLGRPQVEVQRCALSWAGPRLRSSRAHWAGNSSGTELGSWRRAWRRVGKAEVEVEVDADMVEEKLEEEEDEEEDEDEEEEDS